jgi:tetratricopeptide (TPR) repeat protein
MQCLQENTVLAFAEARIAPGEREAVEAHARECVDCHALLVAALNLSKPSRTAVTRSAEPTASTDGPTAAIGLHAAHRPRRQAPLAAGTSIARFTILGMVGSGGMGEVYAAYDPRLDRRVAVKVIHEGAATSDPHARERLLREAQVTARLSHPNVVVVYDAGVFEDQVFIAMEFVDGVTLAEWLVERSRGWQDVLATFVQAARGLAAAHAAGLVHRDFKPQNVMVGKDGAVRVMDFGLARRVDQQDGPPTATAPSAPLHEPSLTRTGQLLGTPLYMAPEQFAGGRVDARTDQFSFCVALYWALYGVHPFGGPRPIGVSSNTPSGDVALPARRKGAPSLVQKALLRGLRIDPETRWPSMDALLTELLRDPKRRMWRAGWAMLGVACCAALGWSIVQTARRSRSLCEGGPGRLSGIWETTDHAGPGSRREAVRTAISKSGTQEPEKVWQQVASVLDRHATKWLAAYRDACEATHVRGEQSAEVLDLRMTCLADNLDSTRALTELLSSGDPSVIKHVGEAAASLGDLTRCGAAEQVRSSVRPPRDPLLRRAVEDAARQLKDASALRLASQRERAASIADAVLARSDIVSYCPIQAEALLLKAMTASDTTSYRGAYLFERAVDTGERCGHDRVVAVGLSMLAFYHRIDDWAAADRAASLAAAVMERIGDDPVLEGWLANDLGAVRLEQGRFDEALQSFQRAIALKERVLGADNIDVAISRGNLCAVFSKLGRFQEALVAANDALNVVGKWSPGGYFAAYLGNRGQAFLGLRRFEEAETDFKKALENVDSKAPADHMTRREVLVGLAKIDLQRGDAGAAIAPLDVVLNQQRREGVVRTDVAETAFTLAVALDRAHEKPARALALAQEALVAYASKSSFERERREVQAWLEIRHASPE